MRNWCTRRFPASVAAVVFLLAVVNIPSPVAAPPDITVTGRLLAFDGVSPAEGVTVRFTDTRTGRVFQSTPGDKNGNYSIEGVPDGEYAISAETPEGVVELPNNVIIRGGQPATITVILPESADIPLAGGKPPSSVGRSKKWLVYPIAGGVLLTAIIINNNKSESDPDTSPKKP